MLLASALRLAVLLVSAWLSFWFLCYTRSPQQSLLCHSFCYVVYCSTTTQSSKAMQAPRPLHLNTCSHRLLSPPVSAAGFLPLAVAVHMSRLFRSISDTPAHGPCAVPVQSCRTAPFLHFRFPGSADLCVHSRHFGLCAKIQVVWAYSAPLFNLLNFRAVSRFFALALPYTVNTNYILREASTMSVIIRPQLPPKHGRRKRPKNRIVKHSRTFLCNLLLALQP